MLRELDRINDLRWTVVAGRLPATTRLADEAAAAFRRYGIIVGKTPPADGWFTA